MMTSRGIHAVPARPASVPGAAVVMALALALVALGACSVNRRSDEFRCKNPSECPSRMCEDGWCVPDEQPGGQVPDAMVAAPPDAATEPGCPAVCDECSSDVCFIECDTQNSCPDLVVCPEGWECEVACVGAQTCTLGVMCRDATACVVRCQGSGACAAGVTCGEGPCDVECRGPGSCLGIDCNDSCACDTECSNGAICGLECPDRGVDCQDDDGQCDSSRCDICDD